MCTVNSDYLLLFKSHATNVIEVNEFPVEKLINGIINDAITFVSSVKNADELNKYLSGNEALTKMEGYYFYCTSLDSAYDDTEIKIESLKSFIKDYQANEQYYNSDNKYDIRQQHIENDENALKKPEERFQELKSKIIYTLSEWCEMYNLSKAYEKAECIDRVLFYSHKKSRWRTENSKITDNLSFELSTNFGYGRSSYFFLKIFYRGICLTPFSVWINYKYANMLEIVRYTISYEPQNNSWLKFKNDVVDVVHLYNNDEAAFVRKFIISECEQMIEGLGNILNSSSVRLKVSPSDDSITTVKNITNNNYLMTVFRGEKISGALDFISKILELSSIININEYVAKIENYNKNFLPILEHEISLITHDISKLQNELDIAQKIVDELKPKYDFYTSERQRLMRESGEYSLERIEAIWDYPPPEIKERLTEIYPEYLEFDKTYYDNKLKILNLNTWINGLKQYFDPATKSVEKIKTYFMSK
jgi:hypothetical protein